MNPEIGLFCLILAGVLAGVQSVAPFWSRRVAVAIYPVWSLLQCGLITASFACLIIARMESDFSVANVAQHSSLAMPMLYKIVGAWGNHEGSMLLWVWVLSVFGSTLGGLRVESDEARTRNALALSVQSALLCGFVLFIIFTSNPFARLYPVPLDGAELNPLLQDIGLALHPPLLYGGYVGFSIVFALSVAALLQRRADRDWAKDVKPWVLASWSFLTVGIGLGSWWAYRELGWGGFWFWDPVENASLLPWLAGTALLHSLIALEKRGALAQWVLLLSILTFGLSLLGTFLVRSGVLTSVHSFASDPARGLFILLYILVTVGGALMLFAARAASVSGGNRASPLAREGMLVFNNLFLVTGCFCVLLGTLYPLLAELVNGAKITVGPPYFNATFLPLMVIPLFLAGLSPLLGWKHGRLKQALRALAPAFAATSVSVLLVLALSHRQVLFSALGMGLGAWLAASTLALLHRRVRAAGWRRLPLYTHGVVLSHLGAAVLVIGLTGAGLWSVEQEAAVKPGSRLPISEYTAEYRNTRVLRGENYSALMGDFHITDANGNERAVLSPQYRYYPASGARTSEAAVRSAFMHDLYAVIGESDVDGRVAARLYYKPLIGFVWAGCLLMALGGIAAMARKRNAHG